jgi:hypothetical protein
MAKSTSIKSSYSDGNNSLNDNDQTLKNCFIVTPIGEPISEINLKAFGLINAVLKPVFGR